MCVCVCVSTSLALPWYAFRWWIMKPLGAIGFAAKARGPITATGKMDGPGVACMQSNPGTVSTPVY